MSQGIFKSFLTREKYLLSTHKSTPCRHQKSARRLEISAVLVENSASTAENRGKHVGFFRAYQCVVKGLKWLLAALIGLHAKHSVKTESKASWPPTALRPSPVPHKNYFPEGTNASYVPSSKKTRISLILRGHLSNCLALSACRASARRW